MADTVIIFWYWWVLATVLLGVEMLTFSFFFLGWSVSGFIVGLIVFLFPALSIEIQLFIFSIMSIASILIWRYYGIRFHIETDQPLLNNRSAQYIGRTFSLIQAIEDGRGKIKIGDSLWTVRGEDCPLGSKIEVIAANGVLLSVKLISKKSK